VTQPQFYSPRAWAQLLIGLFGYGLAVALMIESNLGLGPWDAFHYGIHRYTGMTVGMASILAGVVIQIVTWFIGVRPGAGTIANMILIGVFIDLLRPILPEATTIVWGFAYYVPGVLICGLSTGFYIGAGLGKGPRDGLMIAVSQITNWPVRRVRTLIELTVLLLGWLMGATIGIGTLLFALGIGPAAQWGLRVCGVIPEATGNRQQATGNRQVAPHNNPSLRPEA
jgi:uncharacterized protein